MGVCICHAPGLIDDADSDLEAEAQADLSSASRLCSALARAGQSSDCAVCGEHLAAPYARCSCFGGGAGQPMRAHLHCLATSFLTLAADASERHS